MDFTRDTIEYFNSRYQRGPINYWFMLSIALAAPFAGRALTHTDSDVLMLDLFIIKFPYIGVPLVVWSWTVGMTLVYLKVWYKMSRKDAEVLVNGKIGVIIDKDGNRREFDPLSNPHEIIFDERKD